MRAAPDPALAHRGDPQDDHQHPDRRASPVGPGGYHSYFASVDQRSIQCQAVCAASADAITIGTTITADCEYCHKQIDNSSR
jgi:hypothetical protein